MINVYAWPPVGHVGSEWTEEHPIQVSRSIVTGADYTSEALRKRRLVSLEVSSLSMDRDGAGKMEVLKRFLKGGVNAVRLYSQPINWHLDYLDTSDRAATLLEWESGGTPLLWFSGTVVTGNNDDQGDGFNTVSLSGLPANTVVARTGDFMTAYQNMDDATGFTTQIVRGGATDASGNLTVRVFDEMPAWTDFRVNLGTSDTGVFKPVSIPRSMQPLAQNWSYSWQFREVFSGEVGGFTEVDPWT